VSPYLGPVQSTLIDKAVPLLKKNFIGSYNTAVAVDTFLDQGSRSERYLQIKAHFEV
jgi:hypothetical protein